MTGIDEYKEYNTIKKIVIHLINQGARICLYGDGNNGKTYLQREMNDQLTARGYASLIGERQGEYHVRNNPLRLVIVSSNIMDEEIERAYTVVDMNHLYKGKLRVAAS